IETNNKRFPVRFGFNALREFSRVTGMPLASLSNLQHDITLDQAITLVWCGLKDGARKDKMPFKMAVDDVADLMDDDATILEKAFEIFGRQFSPEQE
uniref:hypothetical protein n=1 Tax=Salmonella sp. s60093 TaxID=3159721 RepID=UPI00398185C1